MLRRLSALALCVMVTACASASEILVYSPAEVNALLSELEGRRIWVRGSVSLGTNSRVLYQSRRLALARNASSISQPEYCLTILNKDALLWDHASLLTDHTIIVEGVVRRRGPQALDLQGCLNSDATPVASGFQINPASLQRAIDHLP